MNVVLILYIRSYILLNAMTKYFKNKIVIIVTLLISANLKCKRVSRKHILTKGNILDKFKPL